MTNENEFVESFSVFRQLVGFPQYTNGTNAIYATIATSSATIYVLAIC